MIRTLLFLCLFSGPLCGQVWLNQAGSGGPDNAADVTTDSAGNVYMTGYCDAPATFNTSTLNNNGGFDLYIAKYSSAGSVLLLKNYGSTAHDFGTNIRVDAAGNMVVAGNFQGTSTQLDNLPLASSNPNENAFVAKFDPAGNALWATVIEGVRDITDMQLDANGNIVVTGLLPMDALFGGTDTLLVHHDTASCCETDLFVAKYDATGNFLWVRGGGGNASDGGRALAIGGNGDIYISGFISDTLVEFSGNYYASLTTDSIFTVLNAVLVKYDAAGNFRWLKQYAAPGGVSFATALAISGDSMLYIGGGFSGDITFAPFTLSSTGLNDAFFARLDTAGNCSWAISSSGNGNEAVAGMGVDSAGNLFVTGLFSGSPAFGTFMFTAMGNDAVYTARLSPAGTFTWAEKGDGPYNDVPSALATGNGNGVYVCGTFSDQVVFGPFTANAVTAFSIDIFLVKYDGLTTAVSSTDPANRISAFPNPADENVQLVIGTELQNATLQVYDATGNLVDAVNFSGMTLNYATAKLSPGIYFFTVSEAGAVASRLKIVITR